MTRSLNPRETVVQPDYCEVVEGSGKGEGSGVGQLGLSSATYQQFDLGYITSSLCPSVCSSNGDQNSTYLIELLGG